MESFLQVGGRPLPLLLIRNPRARRYVLRLRPNGAARVCIPRGGSAGEALKFAERNVSWLEQQLQKLTTATKIDPAWRAGLEILLEGTWVLLCREPAGGSDSIRFGSETLRVPAGTEDLRPSVEKHLWRKAARELPARVLELAAAQNLKISRVTVRNQRSRWGSCSRRAVISLNWRLIQAPLFVRDYIILHELMHLREMNHSEKFWQHVEKVCPEYLEAERWLKSKPQFCRVPCPAL